MIVLSIGFGAASVALFYAASQVSDIGRKSTMIGGIGFLCMIAAILTTPAGIMDDEPCPIYSHIARDC